MYLCLCLAPQSTRSKRFQPSRTVKTPVHVSLSAGGSARFTHTASPELPDPTTVFFSPTVSNPVVMTTARPDTYWHTAELQGKKIIIKMAFNLFRLLTSIHKLYLSVPCNFSRHNAHRQMSLVSSISTAEFSVAAPIRDLPLQKLCKK
jgi:hypothetical protein